MLIWTEHEGPNADSPYDHIMTETPLGRIIIEWKSWKEYDTPCAQMPWGELAHGHDPFAAKAAVQAAWDRKTAEMQAFVSEPRQ